MKHTYIITAILLNITRAGITSNAAKAAKADEDFAGLVIEHDEIIVDDISVGDVTVVNERILAVTYHVDVESDLPGEELTGELKDVVELNCESEDYVVINYSAFNHPFTL